MESLFELGAGPLMILAVIISLLIGLLVLIIMTRAELRQVRDNYGTLLDYFGEGESRDLLAELTALIRNIERDNRMTENDIAQLYAMLELCIQKVAIVRYNAFHNVGSDQSFSVALLDKRDNGVVISGIFGRDASTSYAKPVRSGASDYALTDEEERAIETARNQA